jgi:beta-N-acetylhexosaminidase
MQNYYRFLIPRLNGDSVKRDFSRHLSLVRKGIAGFIVFGGRLQEVRKYVRRLQEESVDPLVIASDLERGLGQQVKGGTLLPPSMALAKAVTKGRSGYDLPLFRKACRVLAEEAAYAGINTIFAPVLDINTNPRNPIIAARAFGEDAETVSVLGSQMIRTLQKGGITACGKHFPGHGDTEVDSHIKLPVINRPLTYLKKNELRPFKKAVEAGVRMLMLGHLSVPALDPSGEPASLSKKAMGFLRKDMKYGGILVTDAMNMGGIGKYPEEKASFMALIAGVDYILHPTYATKVVAYLEKKKIMFDTARIETFLRSLKRFPAEARPDFRSNKDLSVVLTEKGIVTYGRVKISSKPHLIILSDEDNERGNALISGLKKGFRSMQVHKISRESNRNILSLNENMSAIVAVFSETKGWKGGTSDWLNRSLSLFEKRAALLISFGSPYLLDGINDGAKMFAYWDSETAQKAVARLILKSV